MKFETSRCHYLEHSVKIIVVKKNLNFICIILIKKTAITMAVSKLEVIIIYFALKYTLLLALFFHSGHFEAGSHSGYLRSVFPLP